MLRTGGSHRKVALLYCSAVAEHVGQVFAVHALANWMTCLYTLIQM